MRFVSKLALLLALLVALVLGWLALFKLDGCFRDPGEEPRPAGDPPGCKAGDKECKVDKPAEPTPPPIGSVP